MRQWITWLLPPWGTETRRQDWLDEARRWQEEERRNAVERRLEGVAEILNEQPEQPEPWWANQW